LDGFSPGAEIKCQRKHRAAHFNVQRTMS